MGRQNLPRRAETGNVEDDREPSGTVKRVGRAQTVPRSASISRTGSALTGTPRSRAGPEGSDLREFSCSNSRASRGSDAGPNWNRPGVREAAVAMVDSIALQERRSRNPRPGSVGIGDPLRPRRSRSSRPNRRGPVRWPRPPHNEISARRHILPAFVRRAGDRSRSGSPRRDCD